MQIKILTNEDPEFYHLMGPFLSRRSIVAELGAPIWDETGKIWFVSIGNGVLGFAALKMVRGKAHFCSAYVIPDYRLQGIYKQLMQARIDYLAVGTPITATVATLAQQLFSKFGFIAQPRSMKRYVRMERIC